MTKSHENSTHKNAAAVNPTHADSNSDRRQFLQQSALAVAGAAALGSTVPAVHAAEDNTIRLSLIGCGGRARAPWPTRSIPATKARSNCTQWPIFMKTIWRAN